MTMDYRVIAISLTAVTFLVYKVSTLFTPRAGGPRTVPYIIPWLGNAVGFGRDTLAFLETCRHKYGPIYRIVVAGRSIVVIGDQNTISFLDRDPAKAFSNKEVLTGIMRRVFGITTNDKLVYDVMKQKLFPLVAKWLGHTRPSEEFMRVMDQEFVVQLKAVGNPTSSRVVNLGDLVSCSLYIAACAAFFGPLFPAKETLPDCQLLDAKAPLLISGIPFVASDALQARERMLDKMMAFIGPWWKSDAAEGIEGASEMVMEFLRSMKDAQLSKREAAGLLLLFLWGSQNNTWYMTFWALTNLVADRSVMERIQQEIDDYATQTCGHEGTTNRPPTPLINSAITENLRWATTTAIVRRATKDTHIPFGDTSITIQKGDYIFADVKAVHHDPATFHEPEQFKLYRYLEPKNDADTAAPMPTSWGGGAQICKGKCIALLQMKQIIIRLFQIYTVTPVADRGQGLHLRRPNLLFGSLAESSRDFYVELVPRQEEMAS